MKFYSEVKNRERIIRSLMGCHISSFFFAMQAVNIKNKFGKKLLTLSREFGYNYVVVKGKEDCSRSTGITIEDTGKCRVVKVSVER